MSDSCFSKIPLAMWRVDVEGVILDVLYRTEWWHNYGGGGKLSYQEQGLENWQVLFQRTGKKQRSCRFIREEWKFILYIMRSRCLRDRKQLFNHVDIWNQAENRPLFYKAQHRENTGGWREKAIQWGRGIRTEVYFSK